MILPARNEIKITLLFYSFNRKRRIEKFLPESGPFIELQKANIDKELLKADKWPKRVDVLGRML